MGWGFVHKLSKHHELTVFVEEEKFKDDIQRWLLTNENHSPVNFIFVRKKEGDSSVNYGPHLTAIFTKSGIGMFLKSLSS